MSSDSTPGTITAAIAVIEEVSSRIEGSFAQAGQRLGRGHAMFQELNQALTALSGELSGAQIESASKALHDIAERLSALVKALPTENELLARLRNAAIEASDLLKPLFKHIQMISIVARSARIEAASLADDRKNFLAFTQEANDLAQVVKRSLESCARQQDLLAKAVDAALNRQTDFDQRYRSKLIAAGEDLVSAYAGMHGQRGQSVRLTDLASSSTKRIAEAVGRSIVSLQMGDSTRQRLEHVCDGLRLAQNSRAPGIAPELDQTAGALEPGFIYRLQAKQLEDTQRELENDVGRITHALSAIIRDAADLVGEGRSLYGDQNGDSSSFLTRIRQTLAQVSALVATCEGAGKSVDDALTVVENVLGKFRDTIANLSEAVVDITLIGMNASLKAGHLGNKGNAFVVIANELKSSADQVAGASVRLRPVLNGIEELARKLRALRVHGDPAQLAQLESSILHALQEIEAGNERLGGLVHRLIAEGAEFEDLMGAAQGSLSELNKRAAALPGVATHLNVGGAATSKESPTVRDEAAFDDIFRCYTMEREREVHREFLNNFGLGPKRIHQDNSFQAEDGVLLF
jgi:uncharacterized phage infection (PIP) family protein YhgE